MKDSLDILCVGDYIEHHGVKGMHWGIRKQRYTGESLTNRLIEIEDRRRNETAKNRKVKRLNRFNDKYLAIENPSKHKTNKWNKLRNEAGWASHKINKKYKKQEEKVLAKAKKTVSKEKLNDLNKAKEEFSKLWREYGHLTSMRNENGNLIHLKKEHRAQYEKARQNVIDAMNNVTMDIVKDSNKRGYGAMKVSDYLLNEKDNKIDTYGLKYAFDWDIENNKLKKWKQPSK